MQDVNESLKRYEHKLLDAFVAVFPSKRPPKSLRALQPLAFVFLLEAFGLLFLLNRELVRAAILAARGPGKGDDGASQLSILDATAKDEVLGVFVSDISLRSESPPIIEFLGQTLDLGACKTIDAAAAYAITNGWIAYLDHRNAVKGLRLVPRTSAIETRLRAPLANIVAMCAPDKRDEQITQLETDKENLAESNRIYCERNLSLSNDLHAIRRAWQDATGASDPELARELTKQRIEQIESLQKELSALRSAPPKDDLGAFVGRELAGGEYDHGIGKMVWPDPDNAPKEADCVDVISKHRRGEFVELAFPSTPLVFENVRAWLMQYQMNVRAPEFDNTGYSTCAVGANGEIPPNWATMKQSKRNSYPGFVLFAPDGSAKVTFVVASPIVAKSSKKKVKTSQ